MDGQQDDRGGHNRARHHLAQHVLDDREGEPRWPGPVALQRRAHRDTYQPRRHGDRQHHQRAEQDRLALGPPGEATAAAGAILCDQPVHVTGVERGAPGQQGAADRDDSGTG